MSDTCMDRRRRTGVLVQTLLWWTLIGLCCAGPRPRDRAVRPRYTRHHDRWYQRIQLPSPHDQGAQRVEYPSVNDQGSNGWRWPWENLGGQRVNLPSVNDSETASAQTQKCAPGFYRDSSGLFLGRCVPCECNGLADECDEKTGKCLDCQFNTAGDKCEHCKEGYYGNAALKTCRVCPCPFSVPGNSFAVGCKDFFGDIECVCKAGYAGERCESCAPGYYGDPLTPGGRCRPCNCNGNGNNCDPRTGVCKNTLEPGDTNTDEQCQECDNCAQTLLRDLEKLDDDLRRIKTQLDNASASSSSQDRLKKLEQAVADTKILVNKYRTAVNGQKPIINQLDDDMSTLSDDVNSLKDKADKNAADADKAEAEVGKTHKRAKDLDAEIKNLLKKIQALLDQLKEAGASGDAVPSENLSKLLEEAQRLVKEMEDRNFDPQKDAAEKERDEAKKLLEHIKANVTKQCDQNEAAADKLRGLLKGFEAKLKDLDKALKDAVELLKKANTQNGLSAQALADLQKRIEDLKKEKKTVENQIDMAEKELQKTEDLVSMLNDSKTEYEQLAAKLDGAKTDLTKKVNEIAKAAAKEGIVRDAEDHANKLKKMAKELEDAVKNASGRPEVQNAKEAIDAYKNIKDAIDAAEAAANEAKAAADNALDNVKNQKLTERAKDLKKTSDDLLKEAKMAEKDLQGTKDDITDVKNRLKKADDKKKTLERDLLSNAQQLNSIKRDDIAGIIDEAKRKAASANDSSADTMDKLNVIKDEMDKIKVTPGNSNLSDVLDDVGKTVNNLLDRIPTLDDKIAEMEKLVSQFTPTSNISENIKKIKDLIEQARDAANRIAVPVKFDGTGHVEMRAPKNLEDLRAYTSLALSLQRPTAPGGRGDGRRRRRQTREKEDMFVMYLGNRDASKNYIGMYLRENILHGVYKLNGVENNIEVGFITKSKPEPEPSQFDRVDLHRIYQDAKIILTRDINSNTPKTPIERIEQGKEIMNLLDLSPTDVVFYVGGYPDNFTPPSSLSLPKYKGCIEFFSFNDKVASLYNFQNAEMINPQPPCRRYVQSVDSKYFEGTGYGKINLDSSQSLRIDMTVHTRSENGLLAYLGSEDYYFAVTIEKGVVFLHSNLLDKPATHNVKSFPTDEFKEILIVAPTGKMLVRMGSKEVARGVAQFDNKAFTELYFGGIPQHLRDRYNISMQPFKGCVKNPKVNNDHKPMSEEVGISRGCPVDSLIVRKAEFSPGSSLSHDLSDFSLSDDFTVSLGFKSTENQGLILKDSQQTRAINLKLEDGHVVFISNDGEWKSNKQYNDGQWHYLTATSSGGRTQLLIDDEDKGTQGTQNTAILSRATSDKMTLGQDYKGCVTNLYTRRPDSLFKAEDLSKFQASGDVFLDVCTADSLPQLMLDRSAKKR